MPPSKYALEHPLRADSEVTDRVFVWRGQSHRGAWHADPACTRAPKKGLVECEGTAQSTYLDMAGPRWRESLPCQRCALPVLIEFALHSGARWPRDARQVVISCPRPTTPVGHHRCRDCAFLAGIADRLGLVKHVATDGYTLIAGHALWEVASAIEIAYAVHFVPDPVTDVTAEVLAAAWTLRRGRRPVTDGVEQNVGRTQYDGLTAWRPAAALGLEEADLILRPAAQHPAAV